MAGISCLAHIGVVHRRYFQRLTAFVFVGVHINDADRVGYHKDMASDRDATNILRTVDVNAFFLAHLSAAEYVTIHEQIVGTIIGVTRSVRDRSVLLDIPQESHLVIHRLTVQRSCK